MTMLGLNEPTLRCPPSEHFIPEIILPGCLTFCWVFCGLHAYGSWYRKQSLAIFLGLPGPGNLSGIISCSQLCCLGNETPPEFFYSWAHLLGVCLLHLHAFIFLCLPLWCKSQPLYIFPQEMCSCGTSWVCLLHSLKICRLREGIHVFQVPFLSCWVCPSFSFHPILFSRTVNAFYTPLQ